MGPSRSLTSQAPAIPRLLFRRQARPEAAKLGLAAPVNETVARLLRAREMAFQP